ncbi:hypothetical protein WI88_32575 [Burkholderia ubonensis]|nr:hypothetical protein WI88_32575 [Burkholderia ubonensis]
MWIDSNVPSGLTPWYVEPRSVVATTVGSPTSERIPATGKRSPLELTISNFTPDRKAAMRAVLVVKVSLVMVS